MTAAEDSSVWHCPRCGAEMVVVQKVAQRNSHDAAISIPRRRTIMSDQAVGVDRGAFPRQVLTRSQSLVEPIPNATFATAVVPGPISIHSAGTKSAFKAHGCRVRRKRQRLRSRLLTGNASARSARLRPGCHTRRFRSRLATRPIPFGRACSLQRYGRIHPGITSALHVIDLESAMDSGSRWLALIVVRRNAVICEHAHAPFSRRPAVRPDALCRHDAPARRHRRSPNRNSLPGFHHSPAVGRL